MRAVASSRRSPQPLHGIENTVLREVLALSHLLCLRVADDYVWFALLSLLVAPSRMSVLVVGFLLHLRRKLTKRNVRGTFPTS